MGTCRVLNGFNNTTTTENDDFGIFETTLVSTLHRVR